VLKELQKCVRDRGPAPIVTWVSDIGRIELSAITFNNAISKASNFLVDGLELEEEATVSVSLGNHWQSPVWLGTALTTGLTIVESDPAITFGTNAAAHNWQGSPDEFVVVSRDPFGIPDKDIPASFINGSSEVRNFGDFFSPSWPVSPDHNAVAIDSGELTYTQLVQRAQELADANELKPGQSYGLYGSSDLITTIAFQVVLPVAFNHSVVLIDQTNPDLDVIEKQEKLEQIVMLG
jgi:uncharacterized protein (TIGR03089 family)